MNLLSRRLELLKMEGLGLSKHEIVTELSEKFQVSKRSVYRDYTSRHAWQPLLNETKPEEVLLKTINRFEEIYRKASMKYLKAGSDLAQLGALNVMLKANAMLFEVAVLPNVLQRLEVLEDQKK